MKKLFPVIIFMTLFTWSRAQIYHPLADTNKLWSTSHQYYPGMDPFSDFTKFQGEETLDGKIYKKVWTTTDTALVSWTLHGYIREDDDKHVYYRSWSGGPDDLRYDFGADEGDTIYLFYDPMGFYFVVDSVDNFIFLTGEARKRINLSCFAPDDVLIGNDTWIEGMGSLYGVMQSGSCALVGDMPQLICFTENDTLKFMNDNFNMCYIVTGIAPNDPVPGMVRVFPNPSSGIIFLRINDPLLLPLKIALYDPFARQILEKDITGAEDNIDISLTKRPGLLFYRLTGSNGFSVSGKILVQLN